jgi:hypothetical protein
MFYLPEKNPIFPSIISNVYHNDNDFRGDGKFFFVPFSVFLLVGVLMSIPALTPYDSQKKIVSSRRLLYMVAVRKVIGAL